MTQNLPIGILDSLLLTPLLSRPLWSGSIIPAVAMPLPVVAEDLCALSSRKHLVCVNTLMKNTIIRALYRILDLAPSIQPDYASFIGFMDYIVVFCDMTCLHLTGDERFLTATNAKGGTLIEVFGTESNPNVPSLRESLEKLRKTVIGWKESPASASAEELVTLMGVGEELGKVMRKQVEFMRDENLGKDIEDETLRSMIQENIGWIREKSDITVLLPFILAHHDPTTAEGWPQIPPEGMAEVHKLAEVHGEYWKFAPFNPVTKEPNTMFL